MRAIRSILLAIWATFPLVTLAHEGHGHENPWTPGHFLVNLEHSIPLALAIGLLAVFMVRRLIAKKARK